MSTSDVRTLFELNKIVIFAEDADDPGKYYPVQGQFDAYGTFSLITRAYSLSYTFTTEGGNLLLMESSNNIASG